MQSRTKHCPIQHTCTRTKSESRQKGTVLNTQHISSASKPNRSRYHLLSEFVNDCIIVVVRECAVHAVFDTVREYFRVTRTFGHVIQRAVAEHTAKVFGIVRFVAREILTVRVTEKAGAVFHALLSFLCLDRCAVNS